MARAVLSNYLWVPKTAVAGTPKDFAPGWHHEITLLKTPQCRLAQQQIEFLREQAEIEGLDPDDVIKKLSEDAVFKVKNYRDMGFWWALCSGDVAKVQRLVTKLGLNLNDKRVEAPWPRSVANNLKLVMTPRDYQVAPFKKWFNARGGIFRAAPAFGKTFIMNWAIIDWKQWTLFLAPTDVLVDQFESRFRHGSPQDDGSYVPITNCLEVEEKLGRPIIGRFRDPKELFPVTVSTWQAFTSPVGQRALKEISQKFGVVLFDEAHTAGAPTPANVISSMYSKIKAGVTATPERKDQMEVGLYDILGPITAKGITPQLPVTSYIISTGQQYSGSRFPGQSEFTKIQTWLLEQEERNDLIVSYIRKDYRDCRNILVLCNRRDWCLEFAERLRKEYGIPAQAILGGLQTKREKKARSAVIQSMMEGETRVIVATHTFIAGVDIPNLDTLYVPLPQNNRGQLEQALGRIRRKYEGKTNVIFRYFADEGHGLLYGCARGTHKALVALGSEIIIVPEGRDPDLAAAAGPFEQKKPTSKLRKAANRRPDAIVNLFSDPERAKKQERQYNRRLGRKP